MIIAPDESYLMHQPESSQTGESTPAILTGRIYYRDLLSQAWNLEVQRRDPTELGPGLLRRGHCPAGSGI